MWSTFSLGLTTQEDLDHGLGSQRNEDGIMPSLTPHCVALNNTTEVWFYHLG